MSRPCERPECGGELHTDPWGVSVQCPHAEPMVQEDTGRRCPRCDCPDGHEQCQHCKVCPHARTAESETARFAAAIGCAALHRDAQGNTVPCPGYPHARQTGATVTAQQPVRQPTPDEHIRELYRRTAELGDRVAALINPAWGIKTGVLPEDHPFHPGAGEQGAPVDWQAIAQQRERELKKVGEARHRAEQAITRVRVVIEERRTEVAERETDGILPFGTPGASWCDAATVTCARIEDALRTEPPSIGVPVGPEPEEAP